VAEDTRHFLRQKCSPKNLVFSAILFIAIFAKVTENECVMRSGRYELLPLLQYYLHIIIFKFDCKSDFTMMKFFCKLPLTLNSK